MRKAVTVVSLVAVAALLSSCALIFKGENSKVNFNTKPNGAQVFVNGVSYGTTPVSVELKSDQQYTVELKYKGQTHSVVLQNNIGALWVVLDVVTGLVPVIIDAATGSWYQLQPNQVYYEFNSSAPTAKGPG